MVNFRPPTGKALDRNCSTMIPNDAVSNGEAEPGSRTHILRRKLTLTQRHKDGIYDSGDVRFRRPSVEESHLLGKNYSA